MRSRPHTPPYSFGNAPKEYAEKSCAPTLRCSLVRTDENRQQKNSSSRACGSYVLKQFLLLFRFSSMLSRRSATGRKAKPKSKSILPKPLTSLIDAAHFKLESHKDATHEIGSIVEKRQRHPRMQCSPPGACFLLLRFHCHADKENDAGCRVGTRRFRSLTYRKQINDARELLF